MVGQGQVIVLLVILVIGIMFGAGVAWWMLGSRKTNAAIEKPASAPDELAIIKAHYLETAGFWHEKTSGKLVVRIENRMLENAGQLNASQRARLEALTKEWLTWLGVNLQPVPAPVAGEPARPPVAPATPPTASAGNPNPSQPVQRQVPVSSAALAAPAVVAPANPKSIVEQIDDILQDKLANSTSSHKGVRLVEDSSHGVVVWIGLDHYDGVDRVTDPEVRALLREAAEEWERRNSAKK